MEPRRRWGTAVVVASMIAFGGFGAAYLWREWQTKSGEASDDALVTDASADARVARGKPKPGRKVARGGKPRRSGGRISSGSVIKERGFHRGRALLTRLRRWRDRARPWSAVTYDLVVVR